MNKKYTPISAIEAFSFLAVSCPTKEHFRFSDSPAHVGPEAPLIGCEVRGDSCAFVSMWGTRWSRCDRITFESPIAKGHNPQSLTEEQVGVSEGWRLLTVEEQQSPHRPDDGRGISLYYEDSNRWDNSDESCYATNSEWTFRTKRPEGYYLPKPKIAEGFNPRALTVEQVGEGYRLLTKEEIAAQPANGGIDFWRAGWTDFFGWVSFNEEEQWMFRTQKPAGYFLPKVPQYVPWTFETAPKGHVLFRPSDEYGQPGSAVWVVTSWTPEKVFFGAYGAPLTYPELVAKKIEHSLDGGKTWSPAATEVRS